MHPLLLKAYIKFVQPHYYRILYKSSCTKQELQLTKIREKGYAKVAFIIADLSMWRLQGLYNILSRDKRFIVSLVITSFIRFSKEEQEIKSNEIRHFLDNENAEYIDATQNPEFDLARDIDPDIIFYPQPYDKVYVNGFQYQLFTNKLLCYVPYGAYTIKSDFSYNRRFSNMAWKLYYYNSEDLRGAQEAAANHGKNAVITGNPNADTFLSGKYHNPWKPQSKEKKRIIWAPHFSINNDLFLHRDSFLWAAEFIRQLALDFEDKIQIGFKPHPRLFSELVNHPQWGRERTTLYYEFWDKIPNGQLLTGSFTDLFMTSDALIHDSGSFTVEYLFSKKPVMFLSTRINEVREQLNEFGNVAMDTHYIGKETDDILSFIQKVVLNGNDTMEKKREIFFNDYLLPPNNSSVARNIYNDLVKSLW